MTTYTAITASQIDSESPLDTTLAGQWTNNLLAIQEGDASAPKIAMGALATYPLTQTDIGSAAIGQSQLKTSTGTLSASSARQLITLPGGGYSFSMTLNASTTTAFRWYATRLGSRDAAGADTGTYVISTTNTQYAVIGTDGGGIFASTRYFQASPPYDLGDGEIPLFVFAEVDSNGVVVSAYTAPEAPWHYNGNTNIKADYYRDGKGYQMRKDATEIDAAMVAAGHASGLTMASAKAAGVSVLADYADAFAAAPVYEREVTQAIKNADMGLIPRPMEPQAGNTVIMLDPVAAIGETMAALAAHDEFSLNELLHAGDIIIDNTTLSRATPPGVNAHSWRLR